MEIKRDIEIRSKCALSGNTRRKKQVSEKIRRYRIRHRQEFFSLTHVCR